MVLNEIIYFVGDCKMQKYKMLSILILILSINVIKVCKAFNSYSSKLVLKKRSLSRLYYVTDTSQLITNDNIVFVEIAKAVVSLGTIILFVNNADKRLSDHINASDKRLSDHISSTDKRFTDLLTSMKEIRVIDGELLKEKFKFTNDNITKLSEDVEKIQEK